MRAISLAVTFAAFACSAPARPPPTPPPPPPRASAPPDAACVAAIGALADGKLEAWHGAAGCHAIDAVAALGDPIAHRDGDFGRGAQHRATTASPYGVWIWSADPDDRVTVVEIDGPIVPSISDRLGAPEARAPSGLGVIYEQWIYASRGLTLHVASNDGSVSVMYGYPPMTVERFRASWIASVHASRDPSH